MSSPGVLLNGDALEVLERVRPGTIRLAVTSPPYWGRRRYGEHPDELGLEALDVYLRRLAAIFNAVRTKLTDDGVLVVNIGDTMAGSGGAGGDHRAGGIRAGKLLYRQGPPTVEVPGSKALLTIRKGSACNVPARLADAMAMHGWILRRHIVWDKGQRRPEDLEHANRPGEVHESILVFAKQVRHVFNADAFPVVDGKVEDGDVWHFAPSRRRDRGAAPFPIELPARAIRLFSDPGDVVLDPFVGSGTTIEAALAYGRRAVGIDLYSPARTYPPPAA